MAETTIADLLPIPHTTQPVTDPDTEDTTVALGDKATLSHALAVEDNGDGVAQQEHNEEVVDLGWNEPKEKIPAPLVGGLDNEELWILVRRFNKVRLSRSASMTKG